MAKALKCEYEIDIPEFSKVSAEARDLVQKLLLASPEERLTAEQCLSHPWLLYYHLFPSLWPPLLDPPKFITCVT